MGWRARGEWDGGSFFNVFEKNVFVLRFRTRVCNVFANVFETFFFTRLANTVNKLSPYDIWSCIWRRVDLLIFFYVFDSIFETSLKGQLDTQNHHGDRHANGFTCAAKRLSFSGVFLIASWLGKAFAKQSQEKAGIAPPAQAQTCEVLTNMLLNWLSYSVNDGPVWRKRLNS